LLGSGCQESHQDRDQQDVVPKAGLHGWFTGAANLLLQDSRSSGSQSELIWAAV
jgi:hypothetical protein